MLIQAFLQLTPGIFSLFYHSALAKTSDKKADDLSLSFILGTEIFNTIIFLSIFSVIAYLISFPDFINGIFIWILAGTLGALSVASFLYYFRKSGTALFIPRKIAHSLTLRARNAKTRTDAITLGFFSGVMELFFTIPLFIICSLVSLQNLAIFPSESVLILYIIVATIPLFTLRTFFRGNLNLADIQRLRTKNKSFFRLTITLGYLLLAILAIILGAS